MYLHNPRNAQTFDLPPVHGLNRCWILASTPRCGSTLLSRLLQATGQAGVPQEYLNPRDIRDWEARCAPTLGGRVRHQLLLGPLARLAGMGAWDADRLTSYLGAIRERRTSANGWFGLKLHYHQYRHWFVDRACSCDDVLAPKRWVVIYRSDQVAQAVSWALALQTNQWTSASRPHRPAIYSRHLVKALLRRIRRDMNAWERVFAQQEIEPFRVQYETLVTKPERVVGDVLAFLGCDHPQLPSLCYDLRRQATLRNQLWRERFVQSEGDSFFPPN